MKRIISLLIFLPLFASAQLTDGFTDGDFTNNPEWTGTSSLYIVNTSSQLQLNATEAGKSWLTTPYTFQGGNLEWRFWIKLAFSPSGSNFSNVYLSSNQADLSGALNGYFLRFGEAGSSDAIELFKQEGASITSICRGTEAALASSFAVYVKVVRKINGDWKIFTDAAGTGIYTLEASGSDNSMQAGGFFGFFGQYTVSNSTKMYYDDVYIGAEVVDTEPPQLVSALANDPYTIAVTFSEAIEAQSLTNANNYSLDQGLGHPAQLTQGVTAAQVVLQWANPLENGKTYNLNVSNISDISGNILSESSTNVSYYVTQRNDIVINEMMADPSPVVGLPEFEFIELYNTTSTYINLDGSVLRIGSTDKTISNIQIEPNGYLLLTHEDAVSALQAFGSTYGFSSFQLANSGAVVTLLNAQGNELSTVSYTDAWYGDSKKAEGGWTLEQKDPANPCGGVSNWSASTDVSGGTPGRKNSIDSPDGSSPDIASIKLLSNNVLQLWFDQQMETNALTSTTNYVLMPGSLNPASAFGNPADPAFVELSFGQQFQEGVLYTLQLSESLTNCAGRAVAAGTVVEFGVPEVPESQDVVINEVLFHPFTGGVDFVEIFNRSEKLINLEDLRLGSVRQTIPNPPDTTLKIITTATRLLQPGAYALLSTSKTGVTDFYADAAVNTFVVMESLPTYSNENGTVLLKSRLGSIIDVMSYTEDQHNPLLNYVAGVSLERISFDRSSDDVKNWQSASQTTGFASPGYKNSAHVDDIAIEEEILIDPEVFSPDGDGYNDVTSLRWSFSEAGYTMNIHIYSSSGQPVRHLVKSELVSPSGAVSWNGMDEDGNKVPTGIYVVYAEIFNLEGKVSRFKKPVVVATR